MFTTPRDLKIANRLTSRAVIGTMRTMRERATRTPAVRLGRRNIANPAQEANSTVRGTAKPTTITEFSRYLGMSTSSNARP